MAAMPSGRLREPDSMLAVDEIPEDRVSPKPGPALCSECQARVPRRYYVCPCCGARLCHACASAEGHCYPTTLATGQTARVCVVKLHSREPPQAR